MIRTWDETLIALNGIDSPADKLQFILNDIWEANHISKADYTLGLFYGTIKTRKTFAVFVSIVDIHTVFGDRVSRNPYDDKKPLTVFVGPNIDLEEGQRVVFTINLKENQKELQLGSDLLQTFEELGIRSDNMIIDGVIETGFCESFIDKFLVYQHGQKWPEAFKEFLEQKTTVDSLRAEG